MEEAKLEASEAVLEKIRRLLALRDGTPSEAEAAAAASAAQQLMDRYRLSEGDVKEQPRIRHLLLVGKRIEHWKWLLMCSIARMNGTLIVYERSRVSGERAYLSHVYVFGLKADVLMVEYLIRFLVETIKNLHNLARRNGVLKRGTVIYPSGRVRVGKVKRPEFCLGIVQGVLDKLEQTRRQEQPPTECGTTALAVVDDRVRAAEAELNLKKNAIRSKTGVSVDGFIAGQAVDVHKPLS